MGGMASLVGFSADVYSGTGETTGHTKGGRHKRAALRVSGCKAGAQRSGWSVALLGSSRRTDSSTADEDQVELRTA